MYKRQELGLLATRRLEKFEVCSIYTGEIFRTGTAQPPETVPDELSRHTAGGTQLDGSDDESEDDFDSVAARLGEFLKYKPLSQHTDTTRARTGADWHTHRLTTGAA